MGVGREKIILFRFSSISAAHLDASCVLGSYIDIIYDFCEGIWRREAAGSAAAVVHDEHGNHAMLRCGSRAPYVRLAHGCRHRPSAKESERIGWELSEIVVLVVRDDEHGLSDDADGVWGCVGTPEVQR